MLNWWRIHGDERTEGGGGRREGFYEARLFTMTI